MENRRRFNNSQFLYKGFEPYGAADYFVINKYIEDGFEGNIIEHLISEGYRFEIISEAHAVLRLPCCSADFIKR